MTPDNPPPGDPFAPYRATPGNIDKTQAEPPRVVPPPLPEPTYPRNPSPWAAFGRWLYAKLTGWR